MTDSLDKIVSLCKRRGFVYPGSEIYGGLANSWDYGPLGVELKNNIKKMWWSRFVHQRDDIVGLDAALIMNPKVWEASGHLSNFSDPLSECVKCHMRFRMNESSQISNSQFPISKQNPNSKQKNKCSNCGGNLAEPKQFNLMLKTFLGPVENSDNVVYFRPETAQAMFVDFKNVLDTTRKTIPFGIAQIGKAFRNEITPGNFIFRTREFEQMEIEYFIKKENWQESFEHWRKEMLGWIEDIGLDLKHIHELEIPASERAHYSRRTIDFEYDFPFGRKELYGLAYRGDFDLRNHFKEPPYRDAASGEEFYPHVIEPTWGVDRTFLAVLSSAYDDSDKNRLVLKLKPSLAPYKAAVFPLSANKPDLMAKARDIYKMLQAPSSMLQALIAWDDRGNVGKRYYSQDEIGTPFCITIDYQTLEDETATVRARDTMEQDRVKIGELVSYLTSKLSL
ncbi:MAG: glycine--tRNA ligase [Candidatus Sungbacteria bacterium]|uniref:glycine--tRNA ligase n=1 Tax=Candidatus Sungiibacteriota bacterium TaxID=2750080 RepID=A0A932DS88_9BACT|nr:glycine--tRNA ligase [Candidatus Sungbacteria bacterium]